MNMGEKIHQLRTEKGMTLEDLGNKVGVGKSTVRKWENGIIANMKRDKILLVAEALNTTPSYLMGWDDEEPEAPPAALAPDEQLLLDSYRSADDDHKRLAFLALGVDPVKAREGMMVSA